MNDPGQQPSVALAVITRNGQLLLVHRRVDDGTPPWALPGGKTGPGESAEAAAVREAREETGLAVMACHVLGERVHPVTGKRIVYIACDVIAGTARAAAPREVDAVRWVPFSEVRAYVPGGLHAAVQEYLDGMTGAGG